MKREIINMIAESILGDSEIQDNLITPAIKRLAHRVQLGVIKDSEAGYQDVEFSQAARQGHQRWLVREDDPEIRGELSVLHMSPGQYRQLAKALNEAVVEQIIGLACDLRAAAKERKT